MSLFYLLGLHASGQVDNVQVRFENGVGSANRKARLAHGFDPERPLEIGCRRMLLRRRSGRNRALASDHDGDGVRQEPGLECSGDCGFARLVFRHARAAKRGCVGGELLGIDTKLRAQEVCDGEGRPQDGKICCCRTGLVEVSRLLLDHHYVG